MTNDARQPAKTTKLQFESVEPISGQSPLSCTSCNEKIQNSYFEVNKKIYCDPCHDVIAKILNSDVNILQFIKAVIAGLGAAILGAGIWYAVVALIPMQFGFIAILVGFLIGKAVRWGSDGRGGLPYQILAVLLTYCAIVAMYVPHIYQAVTAKEGLQSLTIGSWLIILKYSLMVPFYGGVENIFGLVIIGVGLYEAWKFTQRVPLTITGPYQLGTISNQTPSSSERSANS
jgi:hypothetical protein